MLFLVQLGTEIAAAMDKKHHSLLHALLANLPVKQVVTTNYDTLFELASEVSEIDSLSVLPHAPRAGAERWLLKARIHGLAAYLLAQFLLRLSTPVVIC